MPNYTAGSGEPYWYEWTVGLLKVVEMLHSDSDIESVTLQHHGPKGWDDVLVVRANERREWYQVKHSAEGQNFTFGTLVSADESGDSLLRQLFTAWREMGLTRSRDRCILFTNREAGEQASTSKAGVARPGLLKFLAWLRDALTSSRGLQDCVPPPEFAGAWTEWLHQLRDGDDKAKLEFLSAFEVRTNESDLSQLTHTVLLNLSEVFGVAEAKARPLLQALDYALRDWTRSGESITPEAALDALVLEERNHADHRAPPPPAPFFPSRELFLKELERSLIKRDGPPVLFLSADPGSGKTSILSQLANRRTEDALKGVVGIRYFAFRPITPTSPIIPPDADRFVKADTLWFELLQQLRRGLRGRLRAYSVPVRNELLDWSTAREHVLRLAERLSVELGRPFVIAIDGIDHAARAEIHDPSSVREFFRSLPAPEELDRRGIRFLIAGQPSENYPQYPDWLRLPSQQVQHLSIGTLEKPDIDLLLQSSAPELARDQLAMCNHVVREITQGNTLAVVFAAAEAAFCSDADQLRERLMNRELQSGITAYYRNIWDHCLKDEPPDISMVLAGALSLARERVNGALLISAYPTLKRSAAQWDMLLGRLGPLLVAEDKGYRVRHNDLRVFFRNRLKASPAVLRRTIASGLADHYVKLSSNRRISHASLFVLLRDAGRDDEWPRFFTVHWVMEAAALGLSYYDIEPECVAAIRSVARMKVWSLLGELGCACETLQRWQERCEFGEVEKHSEGDETGPSFLRTELFVRPLNEWETSDLRLLISDVEELIKKGELPRAAALLRRWLSNLTVAQISAHLRDSKNESPLFNQGQPLLGIGTRTDFKALGSACRRAGVALSFGECRDGLPAQAATAFEEGWAEASCSGGRYASFDECFAGHRPHFLHTIIETADRFASQGRWQLMKELLKFAATSRHSLMRINTAFHNQATWWSLRSGVTESCPEWLEPLRLKSEGAFSSDGGLVSALGLARARGWIELAMDVSAIADELLERMAISDSRMASRSYYALWLRAAATVGRAEGAMSRSGPLAAAELVRPQELKQLLSSLWDTDTSMDVYTERGIAGNLATELIEATVRMSQAHVAAALAAAERPLQKWPIDYRQDSLWMLLRHAGQTRRQREWLVRWIGDDGWLWEESSSERDHVLHTLKPYAEEIGEHQLIKTVEARLAWLRISYKTDRDESFYSATTLLDELLRIEPSAWVTTGVRLWSLVVSARATGCDNNHEDHMGRILAKAALRQTPNAINQLVKANEPDRREDYWLYSLRNSFITAATELLNERHPFESQTKVALWCLACGFCRWFQDASVKLLAELKKALLSSAIDEPERISITAEIRRLTPAEWMRQPESKEAEREATPGYQIDDVAFDEAVSRLGGVPITLKRCLHLVRETLRRHHAEAATLIPRILISVGGSHDFASSWRFWDSASLPSALELGKILSDEQLWSLADAACHEAGQGSHWLQGVTDNINMVFIARAAGSGAKALLDGLECHFRMHEQWLRGGPNNLSLREVTLPIDVSASNWPEAAADVLLFLLNSRSGEVVSSASHGIHALVGLDPKLIDYLFARIGDDRWRARWLLNAAEAWAALASGGVAVARSRIEVWLNSDSLEHRLQAWIVLARLNCDRNLPPPALSWPQDAASESQILRPRREILEMPSETYGLLRISQRHNAARSHLHRLEAVAGDLSTVTNRTAELLAELPSDVRPRHEWPESIRQHGDMDVGLVDIEQVLGLAIDDTMPCPPLRIVPLLAQGFLSNEDPWIVRHTPSPDDDLTAWPTENDIGGWQQPPDLKLLRERLVMLACHHKVGQNEQVLAAQVEVYSAFYDIHYHVWWEQNRASHEELRVSGLPRTISARSFGWWLAKWWEPQRKYGEYPAAFFPGGSQRLAHSYVSWFPSRLWLSLKWRPLSQNPLFWTLDGKPVARYESFHGLSRQTQNYHHRQPIVKRWVVTKEGFEMMQNALGGLRRRDEIDVAPSPER
jgi:hypothetical protein